MPDLFESYDFNLASKLYHLGKWLYLWFNYDNYTFRIIWEDPNSHYFSSTFIVLIVTYENITSIETSLVIFCVNDRKSHASSMNNKRHLLAPTPGKSRDHQTGLKHCLFFQLYPRAIAFFTVWLQQFWASHSHTLLFERRGLCRDFAFMSHCPRLGYMPVHEVGLTGVIIA